MLLKISQNLHENTCSRVSVLIKLFIKKDTQAQVFSCEFCEIFKSTFFTEDFWATASAVSVKLEVFRIEEYFHSYRDRKSDQIWISFKVWLSKKNCVICFIENPLKMKKNAFCFILNMTFWLFRKNGLIRDR